MVETEFPRDFGELEFPPEIRNIAHGSSRKYEPIPKPAVTVDLTEHDGGSQCRSVEQIY